MLATAPPVFAYYSSNYAGTPVATNPGTAFTAGANDADGTAVSCVASLGHDGHLVRVTLNGISVSGQDVQAVGDLLIDPAGGTSWSVLVSDLICGFNNPTNNVDIPQRYTLPIWVPAGASIGWRAKTNYTVDVTTGYVCIEVLGEPSRPEMWWCGQGVETLGISDSKGTAITPGATGAAGSWTSVGSSTARHIRCIQLGVNGTDGTAIARAYHFNIGVGSQQLPGAGVVHYATTASEYGSRRSEPVPCNIAPGTQMQVRATCSSSVETVYVGLYGVY